MALLSCNSTTKKQEGKGRYFEGFVEFNVTYTGNNKWYISTIKQEFGTKAVTYIGKNGLFAREYIDSNNIITQKQIYRPDSLRFYESVGNGDTIYSQDLTFKTSSTIFTGIVKNNPFKILNHSVEAVQSRTTDIELDNTPFYIDATYYNDVNYPVDPLTYKHAAYESIEELFSHSPYLTTGCRFQYGDAATVTVMATRIEATNVPARHFEIPKNKIIIEKK